MDNQVVRHFEKAFTLVELAIVVVIIGLLVGGVLQGKELIDASKRQSVMKGFQMLEAGYQTFRSKYNCLPGDCPRARSIFGTTVTSNGNGDLRINELTIAIEHLSLGNMIAGSFMYTNNNSGGGYKPCVNTPCPVGERSGYQFNTYSPTDNSWQQAYLKKTANGVNFAGNNDESNQVMVGGVYTPMEAFAFDTKFDDGIPDGGKIFGGGGHRNSTYQTGCTSNAWWVNSTITYSTTSASNATPCIMIYFID